MGTLVHLHDVCVGCQLRLCSLQVAKLLYTKAGLTLARPTFAVRRFLTRPGLPILGAQRVARSCPVSSTWRNCLLPFRSIIEVVEILVRSNMGRVPEDVRRHKGPSPKNLDLDENFKH